MGRGEEGGQLEGGEKLCGGEVGGDDGLGKGQMAKEVSQLLQQFKDKATYICLGEIMSVTCSEGFQVFSIHPASLPLWGQHETCERRRGCF